MIVILKVFTPIANCKLYGAALSQLWDNYRLNLVAIHCVSPRSNKKHISFDAYIINLQII